ncbi:hypothetical protein [Carnobacterium pleistocenium]|uniref:hypothetical protein n=1 Tax=Carnobacterium pleistocenium TaxID=181073 RepID=UPI000550E145|nr:hypothetical protein [Carnobacterium pleistocenium]
MAKFSLKEIENRKVLGQMLRVLQNQISSGIDGFACGEPRERLKPKKKSYRLSSFKRNVIPLKRQRFVILIESFTWLQATLFLQKFWVSNSIDLFIHTKNYTANRNGALDGKHLVAYFFRNHPHSTLISF